VEPLPTSAFGLQIVLTTSHGKSDYCEPNLPGLNRDQKMRSSHMAKLPRWLVNIIDYLDKH
jgi:hypothetical protein